MQNKLIIFLITAFIALEAENPKKIIALLPARNESLFLEQALRGLACYADAIIYLDDASTDDSLNIVKSLAQECRVATIIEKKIWYRDEPGDKNRLLEEGRKAGGTHFVFLDADELFTANCLNNKFLRKRILKLNPGDKLKLNWIQLWRSVDKYRFDNSIWTWNYKDFIFCDDGKCFFKSDFIHTSRTPHNLKGRTYTIEGYEYGVLHFQFVNWENLLIKQAWYRCLERIREPKKSIQQINARYAPSKNEKNIKLSPSPKNWLEGYSFFNRGIVEKPEQWRKQQVLAWFVQYGKEFFKELDIWDINWDTK